MLITGAGRGIGAATAQRLRERGAHVIGLDLQADGEDVLACDVTDQAAVDSAVAEALGRLGGLDVLINNAGIGAPQPSGEAPDERAQAVIDVNLMGPWRVTSAAISALRESRGRVINVASGLAHVPFPFTSAYAMAKRGLTAYSDVLRVEHGDAITVTTVYPGYIRTQIHDEPSEQGLTLEGAVPAEDISGAVGTLERAALGSPARDLGTTRLGHVGYALLRRLPRGVMDRLVGAQLGRLARKGHFDDSQHGRELAERLG